MAVDKSPRPAHEPGRSSGRASASQSHGDREEPGFVFPDEKVIVGFIKLASSIVGPGAEIVIPPNDDVIAASRATRRAAARARLRGRLRGRAA